MLAWRPLWLRLCTNNNRSRWCAWRLLLLGILHVQHWSNQSVSRLYSRCNWCNHVHVLAHNSATFDASQIQRRSHVLALARDFPAGEKRQLQAAAADITRTGRVSSWIGHAMNVWWAGRITRPSTARLTLQLIWEGATSCTADDVHCTRRFATYHYYLSPMRHGHAVDRISLRVCLWCSNF